MKQTFPSEKFHAVCRVVKSTKTKVELVVPRNLDGYRIVADMGYEIRYCFSIIAVHNDHSADYQLLQFVDFQNRSGFSRRTP